MDVPSHILRAAAQSESVVIPKVGAYDPGDHADLGADLEKQLIASGKAVEAGDFEDRVG